MSSARLIEVLPSLRGIVEPLPLGSWPTPVERLEGCGGVPSLWVKRDDLSAEEYGGSKVRNLEWILADAAGRGARSLLTAAARGSHLVLALALYARRIGVPVRAVLVPQPPSAEVEDTLRRIVELGAHVSHCRFTAEAPLRLASQWTAARVYERGAPYWVAPGGASPVGSLGYVQAAFELRDQISRGDLPAPDFIYCAAGSCGTLIGLSEGLALAGLDATVVGVRVVPRPATSGVRVAWMRHRLRRLLARAGARIERSPRALVIHDAAGRGYGHPTPAARDACALAAAHGLRLETTYTGKSLAGLLRFVHRHGLEQKTHLLLNTFDGRQSISS